MSKEHCPYCGVELGPANRSRDHIIPKAFGNQGPSNIIMACLPCNRAKADMTPNALRAQAEDMRAAAERYARMAEQVEQLMQERGLLI